MYLMTLPGNLEQRLLELEAIVQQFSPEELGPWIEFVYTESLTHTSFVQQCFITLVLANSQRLYRASHDSYYRKAI